MISPSVSVCVWFFCYYGERIVVGNPFLPIRELLSPPCVQMMTMATKLGRKSKEHNFREGLIKIKHYIRPREHEIEMQNVT